MLLIWKRNVHDTQALLSQFPTDIVCLGIGENGHIAFNDPDVANFNDPKLIKIVKLDHVCRQQQVNEKCFETLEQVPTEALTLTIPALLKAKWMFCIVPFKNKSQGLSIAQSTEIFLKNVLLVYCGEKKNLRYIWTRKVHSYSIYNF